MHYTHTHTHIQDTLLGSRRLRWLPFRSSTSTSWLRSPWECEMNWDIHEWECVIMCDNVLMRLLMYMWECDMYWDRCTCMGMHVRCMGTDETMYMPPGGGAHLYCRWFMDGGTSFLLHLYCISTAFVLHLYFTYWTLIDIVNTLAKPI